MAWHVKISTTVPTSVINEISTSLYSFTLLHNRLGHVNYKKMANMKKLGLLPNREGHKPEKYEVYVQSKITRKPFSNVTRSTNLMNLIHSDTCDLKSFVIRGGIKYFIPSSTTILASAMCIC